MKYIFSPDSPFMQLLMKFAELMLLNFLWILGCVPIFTIGVSTASMYQILIAWRNKKHESLLSAFWNAYKQNFKKGVPLFLAVALILLLAAADVLIIVTFLSDSPLLLKILMLLPFILTVPAMCYVFPLQAQFENSVINTLKNAWIMSGMYLATSLCVVAANLIPVIVLLLGTELFLRFVPIWICFGGSGIAALSIAFLHPVFLNYFPSEDETNKED